MYIIKVSRFPSADESFIVLHYTYRIQAHSALSITDEHRGAGAVPGGGVWTTPTTLRDMMITKLMQTPVPEVANCQFFFTNSQSKEANFSMAMSRNTTTANTAVNTREIWRRRAMSFK